LGRVLAVEGIQFQDETLIPMWERVLAGERLSADDGLRIFETGDFAAVGRMADFKKRQVSQDKVYFVLNRHVNPTNLCVLSCKFCDFGKKPGDEGAYEMSMDNILDSLDPEMHEVHIVGGHHPTWPFEHYEEIVKTIADRYPKIDVKGFTASEIDYFERRWKINPEESLSRLKAAGLKSMPGGGAEVFSERVRNELFPGKAGGDRWLEIHRMAHGMGIKSNATLLYGHIETLEERIEHFIRLRELQDDTQGFLAFISLQYQLGTTRITPRPTPPMDDLKVIAAARLMLDNVPHIKSYWVMLGEGTASLGLNFGADDVDGTIGTERIAHAALANSPAGLARQRMVRLIRDAGRTPVERDALYNEIKVYDS
jgi:aminodeoxyfutalosine synthase